MSLRPSIALLILLFLLVFSGEKLRTVYSHLVPSLVLNMLLDPYTFLITFFRFVGTFITVKFSILFVAIPLVLQSIFFLI